MIQDASVASAYRLPRSNAFPSIMALWWAIVVACAFLRLSEGVPLQWEPVHALGSAPPPRQQFATGFDGCVRCSRLPNCVAPAAAGVRCFDTPCGHPCLPLRCTVIVCCSCLAQCAKPHYHLRWYAPRCSLRATCAGLPRVASLRVLDDFCLAVRRTRRQWTVG